MISVTFSEHGKEITVPLFDSNGVLDATVCKKFLEYHDKQETLSESPKRTPKKYEQSLKHAISTMSKGKKGVAKKAKYHRVPAKKDNNILKEELELLSEIEAEERELRTVGMIAFS